MDCMSHDDHELLDELRRLARSTTVPPVDPRREAELLRAFETGDRRATGRRAGYAWMAGLAAAAVLLIVAGLRDVPAGGRSVIPPPGQSSAAHGAPVDRRGTRPDSTPGGFIPWPGSSALPPLESGELVRID